MPNYHIPYQRLERWKKQLQTIHNVQAEDDINTFLSTGISSMHLHYILLFLTQVLADEYARLINSVRVSIATVEAIGMLRIYHFRWPFFRGYDAILNGKMPSPKLDE